MLNPAMQSKPLERLEGRSLTDEGAMVWILDGNLGDLYDMIVFDSFRLWDCYWRW